MRILALIPARGGSKRLPGKNIKLLGGKPLITWSIEAASGILEICDILVSTDSTEISSIASDAGASVPWLRPEYLSSDEALSVDVALHALDWYESKNESVEGLLLLQPTSPFRTKASISEGIQLYAENDCFPVIGVSPADSSPFWMFKNEGEYIVPLLPNHGFGKRKQDLQEVLTPNGSFYLVHPSYLRKHHSFGEDKAIPLLNTNKRETIDIDTTWDFELANLILKNYPLLPHPHEIKTRPVD